jgi:hypothetical protein
MVCESTGDLLALPCDKAAASCRGYRGGISGGFAVFGGGYVVVKAHLGSICAGVAEQDDGGGVVKGHG